VSAANHGRSELSHESSVELQQQPVPSVSKLRVPQHQLTDCKIRHMAPDRIPPTQISLLLQLEPRLAAKARKLESCLSAQRLLSIARQQLDPK